jgi:hypothetical protein
MGQNYCTPALFNFKFSTIPQKVMIFIKLIFNINTVNKNFVFTVEFVDPLQHALFSNFLSLSCDARKSGKVRVKGKPNFCLYTVCPWQKAYKFNPGQGQDVDLHLFEEAPTGPINGFKGKIKKGVNGVGGS